MYIEIAYIRYSNYTDYKHRHSFHLRSGRGDWWYVDNFFNKIIRDN